MPTKNTEPNKLILVVDDSVDNLTLLETMFHSNGWDVATAANGVEALDFLEHTPRLPDLILLDLNMPYMNGAEFREQQERDERFRDIPVVVMSGSSDEREIARICADGSLAKPFKLNNVISSVGAFLRV